MCSIVGEASSNGPLIARLFLWPVALMSIATVAATQQVTNLKAIPGNGIVTLVWQRPDVLKTETYNIYRSTTPGNTGTTPYVTNVKTVIVPTYMGGNSAQDSRNILKDYGDTAVTNGTTYYYQVTMVRDGVESAKSAEVSATPVAAVKAITKSRFLKIMPMGNSITGGWCSENKCGDKGGYRGFLYDSLKAAGYNFELVGSCLDCSDRPTQKAFANHEGWGSRQVQDILRTVIRRAIGSYDPDIILLEIGTNDFAWGGTNVNGALRAYDSLLIVVTTLKPELRLLVAPILPLNNAYWTTFNNGVRRKVDSLATLGKKVTWVSEMSEVTSSYIGTDGIHPFEASYSTIASKWFQAIKRVTESTEISAQRNKVMHCQGIFKEGNYGRVFNFLGERVYGTKKEMKRMRESMGVYLSYLPSTKSVELIVR